MLRRLIALSLSLAAALALAAPAGATTFSYPDFASTAGLALSAGAVQEGNLLRLTPAQPNKSGRVFRTETIDPQQSFETSFAISMHDSTCCLVPLKPADGMAFLIQSKGPTAGEGIGGSLGYGGIAPSIGVEFDIFYNAGVDPVTEHVAIATEGNQGSNLQCANVSGPTPPCTANLPFPLYGAPVYGWVDYDSGTQHLKLFVSQTATKPASPLLDSPVSMAPLGSAAYAGFTAATGSHNAVHDVLSGRFTPPPAATTPPATPPSTTPPPGGGTAKKPCPQKKAKGKKGGKASASQAKAKGKSKGKKCGKGKGKKKGHAKKSGRGA
jgi:hypothetical protein